MPEQLESKIDELECKIDDLHTAIAGPKLATHTGLLSRFAIMEKNITYLTEKFLGVENQLKIDKESTKIKMGIIWYLLGTVTSGVVLYLINVALHVK